MKLEQLGNFDRNQDGQRPLAVLLNRPTFSENGPGNTVDQTIRAGSLAFAQSTIDELNRSINIQSGDIVEKILARSASWSYQDFAIIYQNQDSLESLLDISSNEKAGTDFEARQWWANAVGYETRAAIKRQQSAIDKKSAYCQEIFAVKRKQLQKDPDSQFGDTYNRLVCELADQNSIDLKLAKEQIDCQIKNQISDQDIVDMLATREYSKQIQRLSRLLETGGPNFAALIYELDRRKTDDTWEQKNKLQEVIRRGLSGEKIDIVTMLCTINEFDYQGGYNLNPDLFAYQKNPKVEPVPLIIDEMASIVRLFQYYGINCSLNAYVADTDYTEIGANGPVIDSNISNLQEYLKNLKDYICKFDGLVFVDAISSITDNSPIYQDVKVRVLNLVTKRRDVDFNRIWGQKWEDDVERRCETFGKKKLYSVSDVRKKSLEVAQNIWAVNAAQGAVFSNLGPNTILLSSERRSRDANYVVDNQTTANFPPVLYILNAAENWNRKIIDKSIFEAG